MYYCILYNINQPQLMNSYNPLRNWIDAVVFETQYAHFHVLNYYSSMPWYTYIFFIGHLQLLSLIQCD